MAERPRVLLMPTLTELEWTIRPLIEEWADVAAYDAPGVGIEPAAEGSPFQARAERGLAELDRLGWESAVIVGDELGSLGALLLARDRPNAVRALALGHPIVSLDLTSERRSLNAAVVDAHVQLADTSHRAFVREQFRSWLGLRGEPPLEADPLADEFLGRVPHDVATAFYRDINANAQAHASALTAAREALPRFATLLVHHEGCLMFTREGFEDAAAATPHAETASTQAKPSVDPAFSDILREFLGRTSG